jgi:hypothetical protein
MCGGRERRQSAWGNVGGALEWVEVVGSVHAAPRPERVLWRVLRLGTCVHRGWQPLHRQRGPGAVCRTLERLAWSIETIADPTALIGGSLRGVSCTAARACVAVGTSPHLALIARWNGHAWTIQSTPGFPDLGDGLDGVSCWSAAACGAVGAVANSGGVFSLGELFGARTRSPFQDPPGAGLTAVSCTSRKACTAVGADQLSTGPLIAQWNGTGWSTQRTPPPRNAALNSVSCTSRSACVAVGSMGGPRNSSLGLIERDS